MSITRRLTRVEASLSSLNSQRRDSTPLDPVALFTEAMGSPPDPWQDGVLQSQAARVLLLCSRQSGKSTTTAAVALYTILAQPGALVLLCAPSWRQSGELFRKVMAAYHALGQPVKARTITQTTLELSNRARLVSLPGEEKTIRSFSGVDLLIIDEAARVPDDLFYAVRPMLAVSGGRMLALTTPWGRRGWFYSLWTSGEAWERIRVTAYDCPRITGEFLDEEKRLMPWQAFAAEYLCEFTDAEAAYFRSEDIEAALDSTIEPLFKEF